MIMMKKAVVFFVCILITGKAFSQSLGGNQKLQEVVIKENRLHIPFSESTRDIQIITQKEIEEMPVHSVNELLAYVGGVDIRQRGPFGAQADVSMDGGSFEETLVLLNGIKLIDDQTAHNMMNIPVPLDAIDHIEILRGAAARVYGTNALTGAINIVTKKSTKSFLTAHLYGGSSFKHKDEGDGDGIYGGGGIRLTGNYGNDKQSQLLAVSQNVYNGQRYNTAQNNTRLFYNGNYHFDVNNSVQALAGYVNNRFGANGFYAAPGDKNAEEMVQTALFSLSSRHRFGRFTLFPRMSDRYNKDDYRYFKHDLNHARSVHYSNALMLEMNGSLSTGIGDFGLGWESRIERINSSNMGKHHRDNHGAYAEYKGAFFGKIRVNAGLYANYNSDFGWQAYPGIDLAYFVNKHWKISANIGSGQRIPSFTDLYLNQPPGNVGNPDIQPENAWEYEADIRYTSKKITAESGYFYRAISDFIDWVRADETQPYTPQNFGNNRIHGIYLRLHQDFSLGEGQHLGCQLSYNYLQPRYLSNEYEQSKYVLESLKHQLIAGLNYGYKAFSIQLENRFIERELNKAYDVLDARLNYKIRHFLIYVDISNILDAQYKEIAAIPMPPRWFSLGMKFQWKDNK